jgi:hypothetical protein
MKPPSRPVAFLAAGKLNVVGADGETTLHESEFAQQIQDRALSIRRRNAWKHQGTGGMFMNGGLANAAADAAVTPAPPINHLCRGRTDGQLLYSLDSGEVSGVFAVDPDTGEEKRLFHTNESHLIGVAPGPGDTSMTCAVITGNGTTNLGLLDIHRGGLREITEGDSVDEAPRWHPTDPQKLLYQSAGVGRNEQGFPVALGPYAAQSLDFAAGDIHTLAEDSGHDLLAPQIDSDGNLYYIRRPYKGPRGPAWWEVVRAILLFPVHFFLMFFHIVNNFTASFTRKPLLKAGGPEQQVDEKLLLWGQVVDITERAKGRNTGELSDDDTPMVPETWELVRQHPAGHTETLAKGVVSFDISPDDTVVFTNGRAVFELDARGKPRRIARGHQIRQVVWA